MFIETIKAIVEAAPADLTAGRRGYLVALLRECEGDTSLDMLLADIDATRSAAVQLVELTRTVGFQ